MFKFTIQYNYRGDANPGEAVIVAPTFACAERMLILNVTEGAATKFGHVQITNVTCEPVNLRGGRQISTKKKKPETKGG